MKIPNIKINHLLTIADLTKEEMLNIFSFASFLKKKLHYGKGHKYLNGKTLAMIFEKSSTRTRVSFETGMFQLGGSALFLGTSDIQLGRGETISDTAKVLSRYVDAIMIRAFSHDNAVKLAENSHVPVINGLTDISHPCQALADFFSIYERIDDFSGVKLAYIGDGNNVANSLLLGAAILGVDISVASPKKYKPDTNVIEKAHLLSQLSGARIVVTSDIEEAVTNANFLYTDVWISMGQEKDIDKKKKAFSKYKVNNEVLDKCADNCLVMHCLPATRGEEIDSDVMDSDRSIIFDQAENRLHVQKALLCSLMKR